MTDLVPPPNQPLPESRRVAIRHELGAAISRERRLGARRPWNRRLHALATIGLAVALAGAGTGIAAAAGAFRPTRPPKIRFGTAEHLMEPRYGYNAPGEVTRYVGAGPDGATFRVISASSHPNSGCIKLVITAPPSTHDRSIPGGCQARGNVKIPPPPTSRPSSHDYGTSTFRWTSPTGSSYNVWFGFGPSGTISVGLEKNVSQGPVPRYKAVARRMLARTRWFAIAIPTGDSMAFYNAAGKVITREDTGVEPGAPQACFTRKANRIVACRRST